MYKAFEATTGRGRGAASLRAWLVATPLALAAAEVGHAIAYHWVAPQRDMRMAMMARTGHGYLHCLPYAAAAAAVTLAAALVWTTKAAGREARGPRAPGALFAAMPFVVFVLQEHLESLVMGHGLDVVLHPTFVRGALLQIPAGLLAYGVARLLQRTAHAVGRLLAERPPVAPVQPYPAARPSLSPILVRIAPIASGVSRRGPPLCTCGS